MYRSFLVSIKLEIVAAKNQPLPDSKICKLWVKVINSMKSGRAREATVTRFQTLGVGQCNCCGIEVDAITVTLDKKAEILTITKQWGLEHLHAYPKC